MDKYGQVNIESTTLDWFKDTEQIESVICSGQAVAFQFAALMSGHRVVITPASSLKIYGDMPSGIPPEHASRHYLVTIQTWNNASSWCDLGQIKTIDWIEDAFKGTFQKAPDSIALAYLLNSLVLRRMERRDLDEDETKPIMAYLDQMETQLLERGEKIGAPETDNENGESQ